jgi:uncharacterized protein YaaR (DUF327 family)
LMCKSKLLVLVKMGKTLIYEEKHHLERKHYLCNYLTLKNISQENEGRKLARTKQPNSIYNFKNQVLEYIKYQWTFRK